jgi:xylan 1,4-beta-xylosidase
MTMTERPFHLRLRGGRSPRSLLGASLVARRATAPNCAFEASMEYEPRGIQHLAGITAYYNSENWFFLHATADDDGRPVLRVARSDRGRLALDEFDVAAPSRLRLGLEVTDAKLTFRFDPGDGWRPLGPAYDATVLSDEHAQVVEDGAIRSLGFTGTFLGLWAWDLSGAGHPADFDDAAYAD